jgi:hypothetical protein
MAADCPKHLGAYLQKSNTGTLYCGLCFDDMLDYTIEHQLTPKQLQDKIQDKLGKNMKGMAGAFETFGEAVKVTTQAFEKVGKAITKAFALPPHYKLRCLGCEKDVVVNPKWEAAYDHVDGPCAAGKSWTITEKDVEAYHYYDPPKKPSLSMGIATYEDHNVFFALDLAANETLKSASFRCKQCKQEVTWKHSGIFVHTIELDEDPCPWTGDLLYAPKHSSGGDVEVVEPGMDPVADIKAASRCLCRKRCSRAATYTTP